MVAARNVAGRHWHCFGDNRQLTPHHTNQSIHHRVRNHQLFCRGSCLCKNHTEIPAGGGGGGDGFRPAPLAQRGDHVSLLSLEQTTNRYNVCVFLFVFYHVTQLPCRKRGHLSKSHTSRTMLVPVACWPKTLEASSASMATANQGRAYRKRQSHDLGGN